MCRAPLDWFPELERMLSGTTPPSGPALVAVLNEELSGMRPLDRDRLLQLMRLFLLACTVHEDWASSTMLWPVFKYFGHVLRSLADADAHIAELVLQAESGNSFKAVVLCCMVSPGSTVRMQKIQGLAWMFLQHIGDPSQVPSIFSAHWIMVLGCLGDASHEGLLRQIAAQEGIRGTHRSMARQAAERIGIRRGQEAEE